MFGEILTRIMKERNITAYRIEQDLSIPQSLISGYKNGKKTPGADKLVKLADYFSVSIDYLLGRSFSNINGEIEKSTEVRLNEQEEELLVGFRQLPPRNKHDVMTMVYNEVDKIKFTGDWGKKADFA